MEPTKTNLAQLLFEFVERVVKKGAAPEEIAVLPEVARVLAEMLNQSDGPRDDVNPVSRCRAALDQVLHIGQNQSE